MFKSNKIYKALKFLTIFLSFINEAISLGDTETAQQPNKLPIVITTWPFTVATEAAWKVLQQGGNALDALVEGCSACERFQCAKSVGFGGSPDENGETTLDALIIDGRTIEMGAVAGVRQIKDATRLARYVLEYTEHTMLVGEAATEFAEMMGFPRESLTTPHSQELWRKWRNKNCQPNFWKNVFPNPQQNCGPYNPILEKNAKLDNNTKPYTISEYNHDTVGMIVMNSEGDIFAGTSTNGPHHKIPGRVGDSPMPGSGAYADNTVGAAVATGDGDVMMRFLPSFLAVEQLRLGQSPEQSAQYAIERIVKFHPKFIGALLVVDRFGNYSAACFGIERFPFSVANGNSSTRMEYKRCIGSEFH